jgi:hypothetical protein
MNFTRPKAGISNLDESVYPAFKRRASGGSK